VIDVPQDTWLGRDEGPVVRPYALTGGRTRAAGESIGLLALIQGAGSPLADAMFLEPEQLAVLRLCLRPVTVADLASDLDLPLGVVRILLSDMRQRGLITIRQPSARPVNDEKILKDVADALRRL
jgi:hypothetical protein